MSSRIFSTTVTLASVALVAATTGCRTRQQTVLSPGFAPAPYVKPLPVQEEQSAYPAATGSHYTARDTMAPAMFIKEAPIIQPPPMITEPISLQPTSLPTVPVVEPAGDLAIRTIPPSMPAPATPAGSDWTVAKGDTLWAIGRKFGVNADAIAAANGISVQTVLRVGQKLRIPQYSESVRPMAVDTRPRTTAGAKTSTEQPAAQASGGEYEVAKGDSLWKIARDFGVKVSDLKAWNNMTGDSLKPGQILRVNKTAAGNDHSSVHPPAARATVAMQPAKVSLAKAAIIPPPPMKTAVIPAYPDQPRRTLPHYVAGGDTLDSIASLYDVKTDDIRIQNPTVLDFKTLKPGTRLEIPMPLSAN